MRIRTIVAAASAAAIVMGLAVSGPTPAGAQPSYTPPTPVAGNFTGDAREEVFLYTPGAAADYLVSFQKSASGEVSYTSTRFPVGGYYTPVAGNFDGDANDELIWYGYGTAPDYLWNFTGGSYTSIPIVVNGLFTPVAGDFTGDGADDVMWFGYGTDPDYLWDFATDGSYASTPLPVNGSYWPVAGSFGTNDTDDILWYGFGTDPDYLWDFRVGAPPSYVSSQVSVNGYFTPTALDACAQGFGGGDIMWYGYGASPDYFWDFQPGGPLRTFPDPVSGAYYPVVAGDLFGDGADDMLWFVEDYTGNGPVNVWDHTADPTRCPVRGRYTLPPQFWTAGSGTAALAAAPAPVPGG